jgi:hypothetical protein
MSLLWRKALRRIYSLPHNIHSCFLHLLCQYLPLFDEFCRCSLQFVKLKLHFSICCGFAVQLNPQLFDESTTNQQHFDMSRCCGFVVDSTTNRINGVWLSTCPQQMEKLYNKSTTLRQVVQLVVQQIHSKSTTDRTSGV